VIKVLPAEQRYVTRQPGIVTWSCFASGSHYDPENVSFGALVAVDEHLLEPGAGFPLHAHRGVDLVTFVVAGSLRHEDEARRTSLVGAGGLQLQHAGGGIRHAESNASDRVPLRIVQMAVLADDDRTGRTAAVLPIDLPVAVLTEVVASVELPPARRHVQVLSGRFDLATSGMELGPGDSVRTDLGIALAGAGRALLWTLTETTSGSAFAAPAR
jgi:redox-sensitive bicupin YhaK (pirin superfamily)